MVDGRIRSRAPRRGAAAVRALEGRARALRGPGRLRDEGTSVKPMLSRERVAELGRPHHLVALDCQVTSGVIAKMCERGEIRGTFDGTCWRINDEDFEAFWNEAKAKSAPGIVYACLDGERVV